MKNTRINRIVNHASKLVRELLKEWIGEKEKEKPDDESRDPSDH